MSGLAPEGAPIPASKASDEPAQKTGLNASHVAGGGFAGVVGAVVVAVCNHYGWHVSDVDAVVVGGAAVSTGVGFGHIIGKVGLFGAVRQLLHGGGA